MKSIALLLFFSILNIPIWSQTITEAWLPSIGDSMVLKTTAGPELFTPGSSGLDQVWDFGDAIPVFDQEPEEWIYREPSIEETAEFFLFASLALSIEGPISHCKYFREIPGAQIEMGSTSSAFIHTIQLFGDKIEYQTPLSYGDSYEYYFTDVFLYTQDTVIGAGYKVTVFFDGVGTVITPAGTFENCYRLRREFRIPGYSNFWYEYEWYQGSYSNLIARYEITPDEPDSEVFQWSSFRNATITNLDFVPEDDFSIRYLGMHTFEIEMKQTNTVDIRVFDVLGRTLFSVRNQQYVKGMHRLQIPGLDVKEELLILQIQDRETGEKKNLKFLN